MLYKLNDKEIRQIAEFYEIDIELLTKKLELEDAVINFLPHQMGVKVQTESGQNIVLRFDDRI